MRFAPSALPRCQHKPAAAPRGCSYFLQGTRTHSRTARPRTGALWPRVRPSASPEATCACTTRSSTRRTAAQVRARPLAPLLRLWNLAQLFWPPPRPPSEVLYPVGCARGCRPACPWIGSCASARQSRSSTKGSDLTAQTALSSSKLLGLGIVVWAGPACSSRGSCPFFRLGHSCACSTVLLCTGNTGPCACPCYGAPVDMFLWPPVMHAGMHMQCSACVQGAASCMHQV